MPESIVLRGITWNHTRGYLPVVATAQRFTDAYPHVSIEWEKRSLKEFGDFPIEQLTDSYDLLVIDHPFAGYAASHNVLVPLDEHFSGEFLADQAANSVGATHPSYVMGGHLWALPVDAATPVAGWRADLLERFGEAVPQTWDDLLELAQKGHVAVSGGAVDTLMHLYMLVLGLGEEPFPDTETMATEATGTTALGMLRELFVLAGPENIDRNPIRTWEALAASERLAYCPFAYGYSNYARASFIQNPLTFGGLVTLNGRALRSTLGGTGLAISTRCTGERLAAAIAYGGQTGGRAAQAGYYTLMGGQPGHRAAWLDPELNAISNNYFVDTLPTLDDAWLRPRYSGYIPFQDHGGDVVRDYLRDGGDASAVLAKLTALYRESRANGR